MVAAALLFVVFSSYTKAEFIFFGTNLWHKNDFTGKEKTIPLKYMERGFNSENMEEVNEYIMNNVSPYDREGVKRNLGPTTIIREEIRDKAYYDDKLLEHACPMEIRRSEKIKRSRVPDIIGIGFAKCGTGALAFLDCHPSATFRTNEPRYFDKESVLDDIIAANKTGNLEALHRHRKIYASRLPRAADDELLIEKSPQYAGGKDYIRKKRALAMKIINPNVKLVAIVCDPVKRAYSQLRMKARRTADRTSRLEQGQKLHCESCLSGPLDKAIQHFTKTLDRLYENGHESGFASYAPYLAPYLEVFGPENVYVGDGENMISNPNYEWGKLMDFLGLQKDHFDFFVPEEKGFPCLNTPIRHCLNDAKGTSRKTPVREVYPVETAKWERTFNRSVKNLIVSLEICDAINTRCCAVLADEANSFSWAHAYVC